MALFVYITQECEKDAKKHGRWKDVLKLKERTVSDQRVNLFDRYPPPYLKKRFARQERLIAAEREIGEQMVVCFYRMLIRGNDEYSYFKDSPNQYGDNHFAPLVSDEELKVWLEEQLDQHELGTKPTPNDVETTFLWDVIAKDNVFEADTYLYESEDWVKAIQSEHFQTRLYPIAETIIDTTQEEGDEFQTMTVPGAGNVEMLYRHFSEYRKVFIAGIYEKDNQEEKDRILNRYHEVLTKPLEEVVEEDIIRSSNRSYPALITAVENNWIAIEKNDESNLALSPEESSLLESAHSLNEDESIQTGFPLFINGRAGSGKSTILQYLFTDYVINHIKNKDSIAPPLYLTYSKELVGRSKEVVENLVRSSYKYATENLPQNDLSTTIQESFKEFKGFLLGLINQEDREILFPTEKDLNYPGFKKEWEKKFSKDPKAIQYGPDISWHIIRTYIKGISQGGYMDPEEYDELPREEHSVSLSAYKKVYEKVWEGWYKELSQPDNPERKFWDDQDLVRYILNQDLIAPIYPAVFCDEAQDFTRIELEAILRLSLFSERSLNSQELNRVPFAFAGDPLQTLNPTGFRWESIKSVFVQKFIHSLDPQQRFGKKELNYSELSFNYRSTKNIVKLNNSIQAFRSALFDYKNLQPQSTWQYEENSPSPIWFDKNDVKVEEELQKQGDLTIIVPCGEGGEKDFVRQDDYLKKIIVTDDQGTPQNVMSPARAKGLEFKRVALYGFGEYMPKGFDKFIDSLNHGKDDLGADNLLTYGYFINQLYVAASRPQRRLFIIDTDEGIQKLWRFGTDLDFQSVILNNIKDGRKVWDGSLGGIQKGVSASWTEDREDPLERAKQLEQEGRSKPDSFLLRQAAMAYRQGGNLRKFHLCRAKAFEIDENFLEAGEAYVKGEDFENAVQAFWKGGYYKEITNLSGESRVGQSLEIRISSFLTDPPSTAQCQEILNEIIEQIENNLQFVTKITSNKSWLSAINKVTDRLIALEKFDSNKLRININQLKVLTEHGIDIDQEKIAKLYSKIHDLKSVIEILEHINKTNLPEYRKAKEALILKRYQEYAEEDFSNEELRLIAGHFLKEKEYLKSALLFEKVGSYNNIAEIINEVTTERKFPENDLKQLAKLFLKQLCKEGQWLSAISFNKAPKHRSITGKATVRLGRALKKSASNWDVLIIQEAAISPLLPVAETKQKTGFSDFLRKKVFEGSKNETFNHLHPLLVGAAFERAGRDIDTLKYYEQIENHPSLDKHERREVLERWIITKHKQAIRERDRGIIERSEEHFKEAEKKAKEIQVSIPEINEFPSILNYLSTAEPPLQREERKEAKEKADPVVIEKPEAKSQPKNEEANGFPDKFSVDLEGFTIKGSRKLKRINIENENTMERVSLLFTESLLFKSTDVDKTTSENGVIKIANWNMSIRQKKGNKIEIRLDDKGLSFLIEDS